MPRNVTIEIDDDATLEDIENALSANEKLIVHDWVKEHNANLIAEVSQALGKLETMMSGFQKVLENNQSRTEQSLVDMLRLTQNKDDSIDLTPLVEAQQASMAATKSLMGEVSKAIGKIDIQIPEMPKPTSMEVVREFDRSVNLPLIKSVRMVYE